MLFFFSAMATLSLAVAVRPHMEHHVEVSSKLPGKLGWCTCAAVDWKEQLTTPCCESGLAPWCVLFLMIKYDQVMFSFWLVFWSFEQLVFPCRFSTSHSTLSFRMIFPFSMLAAARCVSITGLRTLGE